MPHKFDFPKIKVPKGERTLSGDFILHRRGGNMWDKLKEWVKDEKHQPEWCAYMLGKMEEIEKQYGIDYIE